MGARGNRNTLPKQLKASDIIGGYCSTVVRTRRQNKVYPNTYICSWECDILEVTKAGYIYEYEVKVSRADFKADKLKQKHGENKYDALKAGKRVNYFSYVCPKGLISPDEIPEWAGLIYADTYTARILSPTEHDVVDFEKVVFNVIKPPVKLSSGKITPEMQAHINECIYYRFHALREKKTANVNLN